MGSKGFTRVKYPAQGNLARNVRTSEVFKVILFQLFEDIGRALRKWTPTEASAYRFLDAVT